MITKHITKKCVGLSNHPILLTVVGRYRSDDRKVAGSNCPDGRNTLITGEEEGAFLAYNTYKWLNLHVARMTIHSFIHSFMIIH